MIPSPPGDAPHRPVRRRIARTLLGILVVLPAGAACGGGSGSPGPEPPAPVDGPAAELPVGAEPEVVRDAPTPELGPESESRGTPWSEETLRSLTLRQKVGQMIMPWVLGDFAPEGTEEHDRILEMIERQEVGGVLMSVGSPTEVAVKLNDLQSHSRIPLLVASDLENGAGFRFHGAVHLPGAIPLGGATDYPPLMAVGATGNPGYAYEVGRVTAVEARALGIHVPFAPVVDVNNNPANPIINSRSFGEDPQSVARMGAAFVRGVQDYGAVATAKHFPGHGDTETDSHMELPVIGVDRARLDSVELVPFRAAIRAGVGAVMTAHLAVPELTGSRTTPATLSRPILTDLLRRELGFRGLVFTDALDMDGIDRNFERGEVAVGAVEAGADVVLMPPEPEVALQALLDAVAAGRIPESRIDASVLRILRTKEALGLHRDPYVEIEAVPRKVGIPEHRELAREIAERSITLLRNDRDLLPLTGSRRSRVLSVTYRRRSDLLAGRSMDRALREVYPRLETVTLDPDTPEASYDRLGRRARFADMVVVSIYVHAASYQGEVAVPDEVRRFIEDLRYRRIPHAVVSFGSPYLLSEFPDVQAYMLAWGGSVASQRAAADALFGRIPIRGSLPTRIPPSFAIGDGIVLEPKVVRTDGG